MTPVMPWIEPIEPAEWLRATGWAFGAYVAGCFSTGYYLVRWRTGGDIRETGSGSAGARNVGRVLGWQGFTVTLLGDFTKGALAVAATRHYAQEEWMAALAMLAVVAGHVWPAQLRFRGGKGVATSLGALVCGDFEAALACGLVFAVAAALTRKTVLAGLLAFGSLPVVSLLVGSPPARTLALSLLALLVLLAHRRNLAEEILRLTTHRKHESEKHQSKI